MDSERFNKLFFFPFHWTINHQCVTSANVRMFLVEDAYSMLNVFICISDFRVTYVTELLPQKRKRSVAMPIIVQECWALVRVTAQAHQHQPPMGVRTAQTKILPWNLLQKSVCKRSHYFMNGCEYLEFLSKKMQNYWMLELGNIKQNKEKSLLPNKIVLSWDWFGHYSSWVAHILGIARGTVGGISQYLQS